MPNPTQRTWKNTELPTSQQPGVPQPKLKCPCGSKSIQLSRNAVKPTMLEGIGGTTIRKHVLISTKGMQEWRRSSKAPPKREKFPQLIEHSSSKSEIGHFGYLNFACSCQTHGDTNYFLFPWDLLWAKSNTKDLEKHWIAHISTTRSPTTKTQMSMWIQIHPAKQKCSQTNNVGRNWWNHNQKTCVDFNQGHARMEEKLQSPTKKGKVPTTDWTFFK